MIAQGFVQKDPVRPGWSSRGCLRAPASTKACGRTSSSTVDSGAADGPHPGAPGFLDGPLTPGDPLASRRDRREALVERAVGARFVAAALEIVRAVVGGERALVLGTAGVAQRDVELE